MRDNKKKKENKMVSEQVATATVFLGAHASSLHWRGGLRTATEPFTSNPNPIYQPTKKIKKKKS